MSAASHRGVIQKQRLALSIVLSFGKNFTVKTRAPLVRFAVDLFSFSCTTNPQQIELECGPMPNVMAALPNIDGALCSTPQSLADAKYWSAVQ